MASERCLPDQADWYAHAVLGRDLLAGGAETETVEIDDYFTGDQPGPELFLPLPEDWQWLLEITVQPTRRRTA